VAVLEKERQISRLQIWLLALLLALLAGAATAFYYRQRRRQKILQQQNLLLEQEKQLADLRAHLHAQELERSQVELQLTKDELSEAAALLNLKNQLIETLELRLQQHAPPEAADPSSELTPAEQFSTMRILTKDDWKVFLEKFAAQFPDVLLRLKSHFPNLTSAEIRLFLLIKIGFDNKQISDMLGISVTSIWRSRYRLVKSLGLDTAKDMDEFIKSY
jgi:DNA-binding NarL/FixJ family response regulator